MKVGYGVYGTLHKMINKKGREFDSDKTLGIKGK